MQPKSNTIQDLGMLYESTRKAKQYRRNTVIEKIQYQQVLTFIDRMGKHLTTLKVRIFYYQVADQQREYLLKDYMAEFLTQVFNYQRSFNLRCSFRSIFDDGNLSIYDIKVVSEKGPYLIKNFLQFMLSIDATQFCSRLELKLNNPVEKKDYQFYYQSTRFNKVSENLYGIHAGVRLHSEVASLRVSKEKIDSWLNLLEIKWYELYADIYQKGLTVRCQSEYQSELITRRYFDKQEITFDEFIDLANAVYVHNIIEFIPNVHRQDYELTECVIDFDTAKIMSYEEIKEISDHFEDFLRNKKLTYLRRLTGGKRGGQHFIIPVAFKEPLLLAGRAITFDRYIDRRKPHELLIDSAKDTFFALCLLFQQEYANEPVVHKTTLHLRHWGERYHKMLFDILCAPMKGRRSVYSLHNGTGNVCVPIATLPDTLRETDQLTDLQFVLDNHEAYHEDITIWDDQIREQNFAFLKQISNYSRPILRDYYTLNVQEFNKKLFS